MTDPRCPECGVWPHLLYGCDCTKENNKMGDEKRVEEIRRRAKRISSKWLVQWVQPVPVDAGYPRQSEIEYIKVEDDMYEMLRQYDAQRVEIAKLREAMEEFEKLYIFLMDECDDSAPATAGIAVQINAILTETCKALGREWGFWRKGGEDDGDRSGTV